MFSWFSLAGIELGIKYKPILTVNNITIRLQILAYFASQVFFLHHFFFLILPWLPLTLPQRTHSQYMYDSGILIVLLYF
jgi:hypothetical protein